MTTVQTLPEQGQAQPEPDRTTAGEGALISMTIDGVEVQGRIIRRCASDITITMEKPYKNMTGGSHIAAFARKHRSFIGSYGDTIARELLTDTYRRTDYLYRNLEAIRAQYLELLKKTGDLPDEQKMGERFVATRQALRKRLRSGEILQKEYGALLKQMQKEQEAARRQYRMSLDTFFSDVFGDVVPLESQKEICAVLEGRVALI